MKRLNNAMCDDNCCNGEGVGNCPPICGDGGGVSEMTEAEEANRPIDGMTFGHAIEAAKQGKKIARGGWNGKNMFVVYMPPMYLPSFNTQDEERKVNDRTAKIIGKDAPLDCQPYFAMYNAQKQWIPGWVASQSDMLAEDWEIVSDV